MNVKKIIKGIVGLGAMAGVAYAAYKFGESNGKINERFRGSTAMTRTILRLTMMRTMSSGSMII